MAVSKKPEVEVFCQGAGHEFCAWVDYFPITHVSEGWVTTYVRCVNASIGQADDLLQSVSLEMEKVDFWVYEFDLQIVTESIQAKGFREKVKDDLNFYLSGLKDLRLNDLTLRTWLEKINKDYLDPVEVCKRLGLRID